MTTDTFFIGMSRLAADSELLHVILHVTKPISIRL